MRRRLTVAASIMIGVAMTLFASFSFHMALPSHNSHSINVLNEDSLSQPETSPQLATEVNKKDALRSWLLQVRSNASVSNFHHNYTVADASERTITIIIFLQGDWFKDLKLISKSITSHYGSQSIKTTIRCFTAGFELSKKELRLLHSQLFIDVIESQSNQPLYETLLESGLVYQNSFLVVHSLDFEFNFKSILRLVSQQKPNTLTSTTITTEKYVVSHGFDTAEGISGRQVLFERLAGFPYSDIRTQLHNKKGFVDPRFFGVQSKSLVDNNKLISQLSISDDDVTHVVTDSNNPYSLKIDLNVVSLLKLLFALNCSVEIVPSDKQSVIKVKHDLQWDPFHSEGFGALLPQWASERYVLELLSSSEFNNDLHVVWETFCIKCFGFTNEVMHFISPLEKLLHIHSKQGSGCFCPGTPSSFEQSLTRIGKAKSFITDFQYKKTEWRKTNKIIVWVSHKDPGSLSMIDVGGRPDYVVGRSMYEFTKIDPNWIPKANDPELVDELWVPSQYVYVVFKNNGIDENKLVVIPEPIDTHLYCRRTTPKFSLPQRTLRWKTSSTVQDSARISSLSNNYKFLSVFKLEARKGWEILVRSFVEEFTRDGMNNNVSLYLVCYIWGVTDSRNPKTILNRIREEIKSAGFDSNNIPHIEIISEELSERDLVRMYASVDAFVLPTRGEGWGLPIIQAMSMGLPAIATNWSGNVDFMDPSASLLLKVDSFSPVPEDSGYGSRLWKALGRSFSFSSPSANETTCR